MSEFEFITREKIEQLAQDNPVVRSCIMHHRAGALTWEQAMMMAVSVLVAQNQELEKHLKRIYETSVVRMVTK